MFFFSKSLVAPKRIDIGKISICQLNWAQAFCVHVFLTPPLGWTRKKIELFAVLELELLRGELTLSMTLYNYRDDNDPSFYTFRVHSIRRPEGILVVRYVENDTHTSSDEKLKCRHIDPRSHFHFSPLTHCVALT